MKSILPKIGLEQTMFYLALLVNLIPVILLPQFVTLDGPSHFYNASLIKNFLFHDLNRAADFFVINPIPVPNWIGHAVIVLILFFFKGAMAEKVFVLAYMIALPVSFRVLVLSMSNNKPVLSFLIFPFTITVLFLSGFFNFCLSLIPLFLSMAYWYRMKDPVFKWKNLTILFLLFTITYFSHGLTFGILLSFIMLSIVMEGIQHLNQFNEIRSKLISQVLLFACASLPSLLLFAYTFLHVHFESSSDKYPAMELVKWIWNLQPVILFSITESLYTNIIAVALMLILVFAVYRKIYLFITKKKELGTTKALQSFFLTNDLFLLFAIILLFSLFRVPNGASAGMMSDRILMLFFIFLILWLSSQQLPKWFAVVVFVMVIGVQVALGFNRFETFKKVNGIASELTSLSSLVPDGSIVLTLNYSDNWIFGHSSGYLGFNKSIVLLDNYEPVRNTFPLSYNLEKMPVVYLGNKPGVKNFWWLTGLVNSKIEKITHVLIIGDASILNKDDKTEFLTELKASYQLVYESSTHFLTLYRLR